MRVSRKPSVREVVAELKNVYNWAQLGLCLNIPKRFLEEIRDSHGSGLGAVEKCKIKMVSIWLDNPSLKQTTWPALVEALCATERRGTASRIATKYGKSDVQVSHKNGELSLPLIIIIVTSLPSFVAFCHNVPGSTK